MVAEQDKCIDTILASRNLFLKLMDGLTIEQLNQVPEGFNNNIIWNFGHVIVSQQILCYKLSGLPMKIDVSYVSKYSKGTKPETFLDEKELEFLKSQSIALINELVADIEKNSFTSYSNYTTSFNVALNNIDDAVKFITMHEGLHLGYAMALKRIVNK
jgi:predicted transcriptional regulator